MDEPKSKARLLETMHAKRAEWNALLAEAGPARLLEPGVEGDWSLKDIIAHFTVYERWTLERLQIGLRGETYVRTEVEAMEVDARNAAYHEADRRRSLAEVQAEARQVADGLLALVNGLSEADLTDPTRFGLPAAYLPWDIIAGNVPGHYDEHIPQVRAWLDRA